MIQAIARFKSKSGGYHVLTLHDDGDADGWVSDNRILQDVVNRIAHPGLFSPADGHPIACAAESLRKRGAEVEILVDLDAGYVPGRVY